MCLTISLWQKLPSNHKNVLESKLIRFFNSGIYTNTLPDLFDTIISIIRKLHIQQKHEIIYMLHIYLCALCTIIGVNETDTLNYIRLP